MSEENELEIFNRKINLGTIYTADWVEPVVPTYWDRLPFEKFANNWEKIISSYTLEGNMIYILRAKVENTCKKLLMMWYGGYYSIESEKDVSIEWGRNNPILMHDYEIRLLYHLESMILLGRSVLDISTNIISQLVLNRDIDSFHDLYDNITNNSDLNLESLNDVLSCDKEICWQKIVCGLRGHSVRDKVAHQTIIGISYLETKPNSDKEYCHVIIDEQTILLKKFVNEVCNGISSFCLVVEDIILNEIE